MLLFLLLLCRIIIALLKLLGLLNSFFCIFSSLLLNLLIKLCDSFIKLFLLYRIVIIFVLDSRLNGLCSVNERLWCIYILSAPERVQEVKALVVADDEDMLVYLLCDHKSEQGGKLEIKRILAADTYLEVLDIRL